MSEEDSIVKRRNIIDDAVENIEKGILEFEPIEDLIPPRFDQVISTGSTLLDLAISGGKIRGGGIPGGILIEVFGPASAGKSAILAEIAGCVQRRGGEALYKDPEGRLDKQYAEIYGVHIDEKNYSMPDTVIEMFKDFYTWKPKNEDAINAICTDSLAALSTEMEMEEGDKMGMRRAKEFSQELRKTCRFINKNNWLIVCSNQIREGGTPGGKGVPFYASLRMSIKPCFVGGSKIEKEITIDLSKHEEEEETTGKRKKAKETSKKVSKVIGTRSEVEVVKSTVDDPYRSCVISIIFGRGIDDVRDNLIYLKDMFKTTKYTLDGDQSEEAKYSSFVSVDKMIEYVEDNDLELVLRDKVIDVWLQVDEQFKKFKRPRKRF